MALIADPAGWFFGTVNAALLKTRLTDPINSFADAAVTFKSGVTLTLSDSFGDVGARNHAGTWTKVEDNGGYFPGATTGNTTPITVPTGLGGLYLVGFYGLCSSPANATSFVQLNGAAQPLRAPVPAGTGAGASGANGYNAQAITRLADGAQLSLNSTIYSGNVKTLTVNLTCYRLTS